jgi:hypothetical protein
MISIRKFDYSGIAKRIFGTPILIFGTPILISGTPKTISDTTEMKSVPAEILFAHTQIQSLCAG